MIVKRLALTIPILMMCLLSSGVERPKSLVPSTPSKVPDYFCTWNIQGFANGCKTSSMRYAMTEQNLFGRGKYQNWSSFYPEIRSDLIFVMDDSWDVPLDSTIGTGSAYLGTAQLNTERFPSYTGDPTQRLKRLVNRVKSRGWKGLGGWVAAQAPAEVAAKDEATFWAARLKESHDAGFEYWKVDWGTNAHNPQWREKLTKIGKEHAPNVILEHACRDEFISFSDVFRTYDVENITAQPTTIRRVVNLLKLRSGTTSKGLINCEDEPYIAAGLGCAIGVMRHPFVGNFLTGTPDFAFPSAGRNVKSRIGEVIRGVRWHRIAEPFAVGAHYEVDSVNIGDSWILAANETWMQGSSGRNIGDTLVEMAPRRVSRGLPLPIVKYDNTGAEPFVLSSRYPSGAVAIVTIGRAFGREYRCTPMDVEQKMPESDKPIGIFGNYRSLTLIFDKAISRASTTILAQDLATDKAIDITDQVVINDNRLTLSGELINRIGLTKSMPGDLSDAGMVMQILKK